MTTRALFGIALIVAGLAAYALHFLVGPDKVREIYIQLRGSIFTGFFTISGFLLAMITSVVFKMKESVYDTDEYKKNFIEDKKDRSELKRYGPLQSLLRLLTVSIAATLTTSLVQLSFGLVDRHWARLVAFSCPFGVFTLVLSCLVVIYLNLHGWFEDQESKPLTFSTDEKKK